MADQFEVTLGIALIVAGLLIAFLSILMPSFKLGSSRRKGGVVIIIGPLPIVIGSDKETTLALTVLAILLVAIVAALFIFQFL